jgi:hypothetical protein
MGTEDLKTITPIDSRVSVFRIAIQTSGNIERQREEIKAPRTRNRRKGKGDDAAIENGSDSGDRTLFGHRSHRHHKILNRRGRWKNASKIGGQIILTVARVAGNSNP